MIDVEILRLQPQNFAIVPENLAPHLEKVMYDSSSEVLIYLTLLYFIFYCTLVSNAKEN